MASNISLGITIGARTDASLGRAFANASRQAEQLNQRLGRTRLARTAGTDVVRLQNQLRQLNQQQSQTESGSSDLANEINRVEQTLQQATAAANRYGLEIGDIANENRRLEQSEARINRQLQRRQTLDSNRNRRSELQGQIVGTVGLGMAMALPIKKAIEFESSIAKLGAITGGSTIKLEKLARTLGKDTEFTASESAEAMTFLGMAGFKTNEILTATPGLLNLASAAGTNLGETADIASNILSGFSLKASEMGRVSDVMAKTMTTSNTTVKMLGQTMKYVAPVASTAGAAIETVAAMSGLLGNVGIQADQAGTVLRSAFIRLSSLPKKAAEMIQGLGVSVADSNGNLRKMPSILKDMSKAFDTLGSAQKTQAASAIFGAEASAGMLELVKQAGTGALDEYIDVIKRSAGTTDLMAKKMQATTKGSLKRLGSAFESVALDIGQVFLPVVVKSADALASFASNISEFSAAHPKVTTAIVGTVGALVVFKIGLLAAKFGATLLSDVLVFGRATFDFFRISTMRANIALVRHQVVITSLVVKQKALAIGTALMTAAQWAFNAALTANPIGLVIVAVAALAVAVWQYWHPIKAFVGGMWEGLKAGIAPVMEALAPLQPIFSSIGQSLGIVFGWLGQLFSPLEATKGELDSAATAGQSFGMKLGAAISAVAYVIGFLATDVKSIGVWIGEAVAKGVMFLGRLHGEAVRLVSQFMVIGSQIMTGLLNGLSAGYAKVKAKVLSIGNSIKSAFKGALGIHSPSRVFMEYGGFINQGLEQGLVKSKDKPIGETQKIADVISKGFMVDTNIGIKNKDFGVPLLSETQNLPEPKIESLGKTQTVVKTVPTEPIVKPLVEAKREQQPNLSITNNNHNLEQKLPEPKNEILGDAQKITAVLSQGFSVIGGIQKAVNAIPKDFTVKPLETVQEQQSNLSITNNNHNLAQNLPEPKNEILGDAQKITAVLSQGFSVIGGIQKIVGKSQQEGNIARINIDNVVNKVPEKPISSNKNMQTISPQITLNITINQTSNEDSEELAEIVIAKIKEAQEVMQRGRLYD